MVKIKEDTEKRVIFWLTKEELQTLIEGNEISIKGLEEFPLKSKTINEISFISDEYAKIQLKKWNDN